MTDEELRRHFRQGGDAAPDFAAILVRPKRRYRPRRAAIGLLVLLLAGAPAAAWLWINHAPEQIASRKRETIAQKGLLVPGTPQSAPAAARVPQPVANGVLKPPAAARGTACTPVPVASTRHLPPYPAISVRLGESGTSELEVTVARSGRASGVRITQSSGSPRLDAAAAEFVRQTYLWQPLSCASLKTKVNVAWVLGRGERR